MSAFVAKMKPARTASPVDAQLQRAEKGCELLTRAGVLVLGVQTDAFEKSPTIWVLGSAACRRLFPNAVQTTERRHDGTEDKYWAASAAECRIQWRNN